MQCSESFYEFVDDIEGKFEFFPAILGTFEKFYFGLHEDKIIEL